MPTRYREIEVSGPPRALGRQLGEAAREEIRGFAEIALERVNLTVRVSREAALRVARDSVVRVEGYAPHLLEELRGVAEGSGLSTDEVMLLQVRNQLRPDGDAGCTGFSLAGSVTADGHPVVGQNWDNDPALDPFTIVLKRRPTGRPAILDVTQAGLIAYLGLNDRGLGICLNTLPAPSRPLGVPHYFTVRSIYESDGLEAAMAAVRRAERAISANILLATPQGPADLEVTPEEVHLLRDDGSGVLVHTNHGLHPALEPANARFPELIQSRPRRDRMAALLAAAARPLRIADLQAALRDHEGHPRSICRHANDTPGTGYWASVFSVILEPAAGRMHLARGNPCEHPYEVYTLN